MFSTDIYNQFVKLISFVEKISTKTGLNFLVMRATSFKHTQYFYTTKGTSSPILRRSEEGRFKLCDMTI